MCIRLSGKGSMGLRIVILVGLGAILALQVRGDPGRAPASPVDGQVPVAEAPAGEVYLEAGRACAEAGYLCAALGDRDSLRLMRWPDATARLRVRVPPAPLADRTLARALHRSAVQGILAWQGRPFQLVVDDRATAGEPADVEVTWSSGLPENRLGVTEVRWQRGGTGAGRITFQVLGLTLSPTVPSRPQVALEPHQVMLAAAHEMGHALGLPHSDAPRDVMYPRNTAASLSARDYRTLEALYALPNGAVVRR